MFSIGFLELMVVAIVGLLVMGPERLPGAVRETTLWINRIKRYASDLQQDFESQVEDMDNDAMLASMRQGRRLLDEAQRDINAALTSPSPTGSRPNQQDTPSASDPDAKS